MGVCSFVLKGFIGVHNSGGSSALSSQSAGLLICWNKVMEVYPNKKVYSVLLYFTTTWRWE